MRAVYAAAIASIVLSACATAAPPPDVQASWGKPGVAYLDYWSDAAQCTLEGAQSEVTTPIPTLDIRSQNVQGSRPEVNRVLDLEQTSGGYNESILRQRYNDLQERRHETEARQAIVDACLRTRGYRQFRLTADQAAALALLEEGSNERRRYMHGLASNAAILNAQAL